MRNKRMLLFLLWSLFWGFANAEETTLANGEFPLKQGEELSTGGVDDSLSIYNALIVEESLNADYRSNVTGMSYANNPGILYRRMNGITPFYSSSTWQGYHLW